MARGTFRQLLVALSLTGVAAPAAAQAGRAFDPFGLPGPDADCQVVAVTLEDPPATKTVLSFVEGEEMRDGKLIEVGYDSGGAPVWAIIRADELLASEFGDGKSQGSWRVIPHAYTIRFDQGAAGEGFHIPGLVRAERRVLAGGRGRVMNADDLAKVRRLAEALWLKHCGRVLGGE